VCIPASDVLCAEHLHGTDLGCSVENAFHLDRGDLELVISKEIVNDMSDVQF